MYVHIHIYIYIYTYGLVLGILQPILRNQMEKKMDYEMEAGYKRVTRDQRVEA